MPTRSADGQGGQDLAHAGDVRLVVLADVGGVGAGHGALGAHPGDRDGGVEASGERDADAAADGKGGQNLAHGAESLSEESVAVGSSLARARKRRARASPPAGSRPITSTVSSPAMVPRTSPSSALSSERGEELGGTGGRAQHDQVGAGLGADQQLGQQPGQPVRGGGALPRRRRSSVAALGGDGVHQRAGGGPDLDGVELDQVAGEGRLGDVQRRCRPAGRRARPGSAPRGAQTSSTIAWCRALLVGGRMAACSWPSL